MIGPVTESTVPHTRDIGRLLAPRCSCMASRFCPDVSYRTGFTGICTLRLCYTFLVWDSPVVRENLVVIVDIMNGQRHCAYHQLTKHSALIECACKFTQGQMSNILPYVNAKKLVPLLKFWFKFLVGHVSVMPRVIQLMRTALEQKIK